MNEFDTMTLRSVSMNETVTMSLERYDMLKEYKAKYMAEQEEYKAKYMAEKARSQELLDSLTEITTGYDGEPRLYVKLPTEAIDILKSKLSAKFPDWTLREDRIQDVSLYGATEKILKEKVEGAESEDIAKEVELVGIM